MWVSPMCIKRRNNSWKNECSQNLYPAQLICFTITFSSGLYIHHGVLFHLCCLWHSWTGYQVAFKVSSVLFGDARTTSLLFVDNVVLVPFAGSCFWINIWFGLNARSIFIFVVHWVQVKTNERKTKQTKNPLTWLTCMSYTISIISRDNEQKWSLSHWTQ